MLKGSCHCGNVAFSIPGPLDPATLLTCHCRDCQQITGTGHARSFGADGKTVEWTGTGETKKYILNSAWGNAVETHFCGNCGTPIYKKTPIAEQVFFFHAGTLDDESINEYYSRVEIWLHSKPAWDNLC